MSLVSKFVENLDAESKFIKAVEFEEPKEVKFLSVDRVPASSPKYGDDEGMTFEYKLQIGGVEKTLTVSSSRLIYAIDEAGLEAGDYATIQRMGQGFDTQWVVSKKTSL